LSALGWDNSHRRSAANTEEAVQSGSDALEIRLSDTEGSSRHGDLLDEVSDFSGGEIHEPAVVSRKFAGGGVATYL
jgi:hypothetical protein